MKLLNTATMVAAALAASLVAGAVSAEERTEFYRVQRDKFNQLDKDRDGSLTKAEVGHIRDYGAAFDKADENRDGKLSVEEFIQAEAIHDRQMAAGYIGDAALTAKVKTALLRERDLKSTAVSVETDKGRVQLSGWVENDWQRRKAMTVASKVDGVKEVKDAMSVR